jgi:hypothetical protein
MSKNDRDNASLIKNVPLHSPLHLEAITIKRNRSLQSALRMGHHEKSSP